MLIRKQNDSLFVLIFVIVLYCIIAFFIFCCYANSIVVYFFLICDLNSPFDNWFSLSSYLIFFFFGGEFSVEFLSLIVIGLGYYSIVEKQFSKAQKWLRFLNLQ